MTEVKIYTVQEEGYNNNFNVRGTFLHGQLENDRKYDIFSFDKDYGFEDGIHSLMVNDKECYFMLWTSDGRKHGYLIYKDDKDLSFCLDNYIDKKTTI